MRFFEVLIADGAYHGSEPLTYSYDELLERLSIVSVPLRNKYVTGYVLGEVTKPDFGVKPIKTVLSKHKLPFHCIELAQWISAYYFCTYSDALRQFGPTSTVIRRAKTEPDVSRNEHKPEDLQPLTADQKIVVDKVISHPSTSVLLHGETGSGKTRIYLELASRTLKAGQAVMILTPEIGLTGQLSTVLQAVLKHEVIVLHSELSAAEKKKLWFKILESSVPLVIIGPRSALFAPIANLGLVVVDESHEPAYKQEQSPRYSALRVASQLGLLTGARVIFGSATPSVADYYVAAERNSVIRITKQAKTGAEFKIDYQIVDLRDKNQFKKNRYVSDSLINKVNDALSRKEQVLLYYNRRGSARVIMCDSCGWQMLCPNCDIPLVYHADEHISRCHTCGYKDTPPQACPNCANPDIIYKSIGSKALEQLVAKLFPQATVKRYDSDNMPGERLNETYQDILDGKADILVGTQLLAKGLDLPKLTLVGVIAAETSLSLPDFTAEERTYQLLYQVVGRVGRGHSGGEVVVQTYEPESVIIKAAVEHDWDSFYKSVLKERQNFRFPPYSYLMKAVCRRSTLAGAQKAAEKFKEILLHAELNAEIVGPTPSFYEKRGKYFYYQLVLKSKNRSVLLKLAALAPAAWTIDIDPADLL